MVLTPEQIETFRQRGYVVLKGFIAPADIGRIGAWLDRLASTPEESGSEARYYEKSPVTGQNMLVRVENFIGPEHAEASRLLLPDRARQALEQLLGEPAVLFKEKINYKLPGCRADKLHQDQSAGWNAYCDFFITMAVAVDENRLDNAALSFLNTGRYEKRLMTPEWQPLSQDDPPYQPEADYALIEADPGDVIFFDSYVPHGSPPNRGKRQRRNIYLTFNRRSAGDMRRRYYTDKWASYPPNKPGEAREDKSYRV